MKNKKVKYLAMLLVFSMAVSPMSYTKAYAENAETAQAAGAVNAHRRDAGRCLQAAGDLGDPVEPEPGSVPDPLLPAAPAFCAYPAFPEGDPGRPAGKPPGHRPGEQPRAGNHP